MKDVDIGESLEKCEDREREKKIQDLSEQDLNSNFNPKNDGKSIIIMIVVIVGVFAVLLSGIKFYGGLDTAAVINVDELHKNNLEGSLSEKEGLVYNGFSFVKVDGLWWTEINGLDSLLKIPLHFNPKEVEDVHISGELSDNFNVGSNVYIAIDPTIISGHYVIAMREISANIGKGINRNSVGACVKEGEGCEGREILNCKNTKGLPVVELEPAEEPGIELSGTCIKVKGQEYGIIKSANRLLYKWYGVME